jgi:hypothetical protein
MLLKRICIFLFLLLGFTIKIDKKNNLCFGFNSIYAQNPPPGQIWGGPNNNSGSIGGNSPWTYYAQNGQSWSGSVSWLGNGSFSFTGLWGTVVYQENGLGGALKSYGVKKSSDNGNSNQSNNNNGGGGMANEDEDWDDGDFGDGDDWGDIGDIGDGGGGGGDEGDIRLPNLILDGGEIDIVNPNVKESLGTPCLENTFLLPYRSGIIKFSPAQMAKIDKIIFDGNEIIGFIEKTTGKRFLYAYGVGTMEQVGAANPTIYSYSSSYNFICFECLEADYNILAATYTDPKFRRFEAEDLMQGSRMTWVYKNIPNDEKYKWSFSDKIIQTAVGSKINAVFTNNASSIIDRNKLYCYELKEEDIINGMSFKRDKGGTFIKDEVQNALDHNINVPEWLAKIAQKLNHVITTPCSRQYVASKLIELHNNAIYKAASPPKQAEMEYYTLGYFSFFAMLNCGTDELQAKGKSSTVQFGYGVANELVNSLDVVSIIDGTCQLVNGATSTLTSQVKIVADAIKEVCVDEFNTSGNFDFERAAKKILFKISKESFSKFNTDFDKISKVAEHFKKMYFTECDIFKFTDGTTGDICAYRNGQVTTMVVPIILTLGDYAIVKVTTLINTSKLAYIAKSKAAAELLADAKQANKVINDIDVVAKDAGDVPTSVVIDNTKDAKVVSKGDIEVEIQAVYLYANEADLATLNQVSTNLLTSGKRSITDVHKLVNGDKRIVIQPQKGTVLEQKVVDYMNTQPPASATSAVKGEMLEEVGAQAAREICPSCDTKLYKSNGSNNGFDIISVKKDASGNIEKVYIYESKPLDNGTRIELPNPTTKGVQMSDDWIRSTIGEMESSTDVLISGMGAQLRIAYNSNKIERYVSTVDRKLKQVVILKLDNF